MIEALLLGFFTALVNIIIAMVVIKIANKKDTRKFNKYVLGSFLIRLIAVLLIITLIFVFTKVDKVYFSLSFLITTFVLIFVEVIYFHKMKKIRKT